MKVMKFGGSSLGDAEKIRQVGKIILDGCKEGKTSVVLSAIKNVTDELIQCAGLAEKGDTGYRKRFKCLEKRHMTIFEDLISEERRKPAQQTLENNFKELEAILHSVELIQECSTASHNLIMSFGERLSCLIVAEYLTTEGLDAVMVDAREMIIVKDRPGPIAVLPVTNKKIKEKIGNCPGLPIITGFIASTEGGVTTTLGRDGSDFTASLIGVGTGVEAIEIWTDVDGVMSADPRTVESAYVIPELSYEEAMELSYFGAKVIHPNTMIPAVEGNIPIHIKNTFNPAAPGTRITGKAASHKTPITGIASIRKLALINIQGGGMIGVPGIAARILGTLARNHVNIIMISQASSEHSICLVFRESEVGAIRRALNEELAVEFESGKIQDLNIVQNLAIIAVIGENMHGTPGISGRLFSALGEEGINVLAIAQGSSERNISLVTGGRDMEKALNSIHRAFLE